MRPCRRASQSSLIALLAGVLLTACVTEPHGAAVVSIQLSNSQVTSLDSITIEAVATNPTGDTLRAQPVDSCGIQFFLRLPSGTQTPYAVQAPGCADSSMLLPGESDTVRLVWQAPGIAGQPSAVYGFQAGFRAEGNPTWSYSSEQHVTIH
jgi:hypothetical protein